MRSRLLASALLTLTLALVPLASPGQVPAPQLTGPIDNAQRVTLRGSQSPLVARAVDLGPVAASLPLSRIELWLRPTPAQQSALRLLLKEQQDPFSPEFHRWLTPAQFAARFGANPADLARLQAWLESFGLTVREVAPSGNYIAFTGTAAAVASAFGTSIHSYRAQTQLHYAPANEPALPAAIAPLVAGITGLDDFHPVPAAGPRDLRPQSTGNTLTPPDLYTEYDLNPLYQQGYTGAGQKVVVVGQSDPSLSDLETFRSTLGLAGNDPTVTLVPGVTDPGTTGDLGEADIDLEWLEAVAPGAAINYVVAPDATDAAIYAIANDLAPVVSISFGLCEANFSAAQVTAMQNASQQATAQGITVVASSGDQGAAACDTAPGASAESIAVHGLAVNLPASLPDITAVGGTEFLAQVSAGGAPAPETAWNDTASQNKLLASGGGQSTLFPKPDWQNVPGVPTSPNARFVPDLALDASVVMQPYFLVYQGSPYSAGGTSVATPIFAGALVLLNQYLVAAGIQSAPGLGNANPNLYQLSQVPSPPFRDITTGDNKVPCQAGSPNCPNGGTIGYAAGTGYDEVTGLGSVDFYQLAFLWAQYHGKPSVAVNPSTLTFSGIDIGTSESLSIEVVNSGNGVAPLGAASIAGPNAADFSLKDNCPAVLYGGDQCAIVVTFKPTGSGNRTATLTLAGSTTTIATVALSSAVLPPELELSQSAFFFGDQIVGTKSSPQQTIIVNYGQTPSSTLSAALSGPNASDFTTTQCPAVLNPSTPCELLIFFAPTGAGLRTATLTLTSDAANSPQTITLTGEGQAQIRLDRASVAFNTQSIGAPGPGVVVTLSNSSSAALDLSTACPSGSTSCQPGAGSATGTAGIQLTGSGASSFAAVSDCGSQLATGSCHVTVWFNPTAAGSPTAAVQIYSAKSSQTFTIPLTGTGATPASGAQPFFVTSGLTAAAVVAGNDQGSLPTQGAAATASSLLLPKVLTTDAQGDLYAGVTAVYGQCLTNNCDLVLKIDHATHTVTTVAGNLSATSDTGPATQSRIDHIVGLAVDPAGDLFINDNTTLVKEVPAGSNIMKIVAGGTSSTLPPADGTPATAAALKLYAMAVDNSGNLYFGDDFPGWQGIKEVPAATGLIQTITTDSRLASLSYLGFSPTGSLTAVVGGEIFTVTGTSVQSLATTNSGVLSVIGFDPAGNLIYSINSAQGQLGRWDFASGSFDALGTLPATASNAGAAIDSAGNIYFISEQDEIVMLSPAPPALTFAATPVGTAAAALAAAISDGGPGTLTVSGASITGPDAADFTFKLSAPPAGVPCPSIAPGTSGCSLQIGFKPSALGDRTASLEIDDNAPGSPHIYPLHGVGTVVTPTFTFTVTPAPAQMGPVPQFVASAPQLLTVTNTGSEPAAPALQTAPPFQVSGCLDVLPAGGTCTASLTFTPTALVTYPGGTTVHGSLWYASGTVLPLTGIELPAQAVAIANPKQLSFAVAAIGDASSVQTVTVTNTGSAALSLAVAVLNDGSPTSSYSDFKIVSSTCSDPVAPAASCSIGVVFNPGATGTKSATLAFTDNAFKTLSDSGVALVGATAVPTAITSASSISFANQPTGLKSAAQVLTLNNTGFAALTITGVTITGANAADFSDSSQCPASLAAGSSCTIQIFFTPSATLQRAATLTLADNAPGSPQLISLSGTGVPAAAVASLSPSSLTFASQPTGSTSAAQSVTLTNSGNVPLTLTSIAASGDFAETNTCGTSLDAGKNCAIAVTFTATATGSRAGALTLTDNASDSPQSVSLTGTGVIAAPAVSLSPTSLTFAAQATASTSAAQNVTLTNSGNAPLTLTSIAASGDFAETNTCGTSLDAGKNCTLAVTFKPTATGSRTGALTVTDNAADSPQSVALTGTGADLTIAPGSGSSASSTVAAGQSASYALSFAPVDGLAGTFTLTCTGAPTGATCTPNPAQINLSGSAAVSVNVAVTTTARSLLAPPPGDVPSGPAPALPVPELWLAALILLAAALGLILLGSRRTRRATLAGLVFGLLALAVSCGGGGGAAATGGSGGNSAPTGTPAGTYTLTVTAANGSVTRSLPLTLIVN